MHNWFKKLDTEIRTIWTTANANNSHMIGTRGVTSTSGRDFYSNTVVEAVTFTEDTTGGIFQKKNFSKSVQTWQWAFAQSYWDYLKQLCHTETLVNAKHICLFFFFFFPFLFFYFYFFYMYIYSFAAAGFKRTWKQNWCIWKLLLETESWWKKKLVRAIFFPKIVHNFNTWKIEIEHLVNLMHIQF